jgi:predicted membrane protein
MVLKTFALYNFNLPSNEALLIQKYFLTERSLTVIGLVTTFYAASVIYNWYCQKEEWAKAEWGIGRAFFITATFFLVPISSYDIYGNFMSITWIACAFIFFGIGFLIKDKWFRYLALSLIGLIILRLLLYDIKGLPTLYRMALFIGMGVALLGASFVYARIASLQKKEK